MYHFQFNICLFLNDRFNFTYDTFFVTNDYPVNKNTNCFQMLENFSASDLNVLAAISLPLYKMIQNIGTCQGDFDQKYTYSVCTCAEGLRF